MLSPANPVRSATLFVCLVVPMLVPWSAAQADNVLLVVVDDVGSDTIGLTTANSWVLTALASKGVRFQNAWATPVCSPTRATIQTGRYPFRTGTQDVNPEGTAKNSSALPRCELTIPEVLDIAGGASPAAHAAIGKWHLGGNLVGGTRSPNKAGYSHFAGAEENLDSFIDWTKIVDGSSTLNYATHATIDNVTEARDWINAHSTQPWFLYLAFNAPHAAGRLFYQRPPAPFNEIMPPESCPPESEVCTPFPVGAICAGGNTPPPSTCYKAMLQNVDRKLQWLMNEIGDPNLDHTTVIFIGDNGTPNEISGVTGRGKATMYESGVKVPLIIGGPHVVAPNRTSTALVHSVDLFATAIELMTGSTPNEILDLEQLPVLDSQSLVPILDNSQTGEFRSIVYTQYKEDVALRKGQYKLIVKKIVNPPGEVQELYDLDADPMETNNLNPGNAEAETARSAMLSYRNSLTSAIHDCDEDEVKPWDDNCDEPPANVDQADGENSGVGDGVGDGCDNCPAHANGNQIDTDGDEVGNTCDNCPNDYNPAQNAVGNPTVTVNTPNGGEVLKVGLTTNLTWSASDICGGVSSVDLRLYRAGINGPYSTIASSIPNSGTHNWTITGPITSGFTALLKVVARDPAPNEGSDVSNSGFKITCNLCVADFCREIGERCTSTGCTTAGCCGYTCTSDPGCTVVDSCPPNSCIGCF